METRTCADSGEFPVDPAPTHRQNEISFSFLSVMQRRLENLMPVSTKPKIETIEALLDVNYTWGYEDSRQELRDLYVRATKSQWIADQKIDWSINVDPEADATPEFLHPLFGSDIFNKLSTKERRALNPELNAWTMSQFLHGEQGALLAAGQLVVSMQDLDGKLYSATQVVDEARHVDVYNRYLHEKIGFSYGISPHLKTLLDLILKDSRWDIKLLGMQIMVEGLALAAFGLIRQNSLEPLIVDITRYVMADEARHVAFGVLSLADYYKELSESERNEREDFVFEAARLMRDRFLFEEVWQKIGYPVEECKEITLHATAQVMFRQMLFSKIVPAVKRIGLLSDRQRKNFEDLGILKFENAADPFMDLENSQDDVLQTASA